mmetsp:Transcript_35479/g.57856  ORF Transcript_35479/g.57856 Transcript_35479/m.57856 type:complete len:204 (+) Transcript_35479:56-667(+)
MNSPRDNVASSTASFNNPLLSSSLPHRHLRSKRRHHHSNANDEQLSASIPLPKSHIHRTPSELQLADDMRRAEYEDVRMYARIVVGMQSQCLVSGYIHPLTRKSLQDVLKTKQANTEELEIEKKLHDHYEEDEDCELPYEEERDENSVGTPLPYHPMGTSAHAPTVVKTPSFGSIISNLSNAPPESWQEEQDPHDECVFSLEL